MAKKPQLWSGRFKEPVDEQVKRFTASVGFDQRLAKQDIRGSLAHARMLAACGILSRRDLTAIERGLARVGREIDRGRFKWSLEAEDVHFNIERRLTALVGEAGKRLHTARSRNDQVATDLRLWLRDEIDAIRGLIAALSEALLAQAARHAALVMPGFTHLQVGQPAVRLRAAAGSLPDRLLDHAAEEEPRRAGAGARQERPRVRQPGRAARADEGAAPRL